MQKTKNKTKQTNDKICLKAKTVHAKQNERRFDEENVIDVFGFGCIAWARDDIPSHRKTTNDFTSHIHTQELN